MSDRKVIRVVYSEPEDDQGMVLCIIQEGTMVLNSKEKFRTFELKDPWPVKIPAEVLRDPNSDDIWEIEE